MLPCPPSASEAATQDRDVQLIEEEMLEDMGASDALAGPARDDTESVGFVKVRSFTVG